MAMVLMMMVVMVVVVKMVVMLMKMMMALSMYSFYIWRDTLDAAGAGKGGSLSCPTDQHKLQGFIFSK